MTVRHSTRALVAVSGLAVLGAAGLGVAEAAAAPTCFGKAATIVGEKGKAEVVGTNGPDVMFSLVEGQVLRGRGGDDRICGQASVYGGLGDDRLAVIREGEYLLGYLASGGPGDDVIRRLEPADSDPHFHITTVGGPGADRLYGGPNWDLLFGGRGPDRILAGGRFDMVFGGPGPDVVTGGWGDDVLHGQHGDDLLRGEAGRDTLRGGSGNDTGRGGEGNDRISGGQGLDTAVGGPGTDRCRDVEAEDCELP